MGRVITRVLDPIVLYVSGGNTQVIAYSLKRYIISYYIIHCKTISSLIDSIDIEYLVKQLMLRLVMCWYTYPYTFLLSIAFVRAM
jgi:hypothetical protein